MEIVEADEESEEPGDQTFGWSMDWDKDGPKEHFFVETAVVLKIFLGFGSLYYCLIEINAPVSGACDSCD